MKLNMNQEIVLQQTILAGEDLLSCFDPKLVYEIYTRSVEDIRRFILVYAWSV